MFNDTILNNLLIANKNCTFTDVKKYCKMVGLDNDISIMKEQYNTILGVDGIAEKDLIKLISGISKKSIVILITHKVTSAMNSDKIFLLADGKIHSFGKHKQLIKENEYYKQLFQVSE
ncbi:MAG: hypothetical protein Q4A78_12525 [Peptostreptococcaceae bacterium]|nr:hypothetical protein [Peptostreptococcaceae bacterium]